MNFTVLLPDTAYCKNYEKNAWYYFDDSSVSESDEESTVVSYLTRVLRSIDFALCENKGADQLCSNCTADQHL